MPKKEFKCALLFNDEFQEIVIPETFEADFMTFSPESKMVEERMNVFHIEEFDVDLSVNKEEFEALWDEYYKQEAYRKATGEEKPFPMTTSFPAVAKAHQYKLNRETMKEVNKHLKKLDDAVSKAFTKMREKLANMDAPDESSRKLVTLILEIAPKGEEEGTKEMIKPMYQAASYFNMTGVPQ